MCTAALHSRAKEQRCAAIKGGYACSSTELVVARREGNIGGSTVGKVDSAGAFSKPPIG